MPENAKERLYEAVEDTLDNRCNRQGQGGEGRQRCHHVQDRQDAAPRRLHNTQGPLPRQLHEASLP